MTITIDASIFVSAARPEEEHRAESQRFLDQFLLTEEVVFCPALILAECAAAIARRTADADLARGIIARIERFGNLQLVELTVERARQAALIAAIHRLRGADAIYVAVAAEFGATLITWDAEMLARGAAAVTVQTPGDWLATLPPPPTDNS